MQVKTTDVSGFNEAVDDRVSALVVAGTGISATYNDGANTLTVAVTATGPTMIYKTSDENRSSTTAYTDDSTLITGTLATGTYIIRAVCLMKPANDTMGYHIQNLFTGSMSTKCNYLRTTNSFLSTPESIQTGSSNSMQKEIAGGTSSVSQVNRVEFIHTLDVTSTGTWSVQWGQATSNGSNLTMKLGSFIEYTKIA